MLRSSALALFLLTACAPSAEPVLEGARSDAQRNTSSDFDTKTPPRDVPVLSKKTKGGMKMLGGQEGEPFVPPVDAGIPTPEPAPPPTGEPDDEDGDGLIDGDFDDAFDPGGIDIKDDTADTGDTGDVKD